jgi:hypothetical protein
MIVKYISHTPLGAAAPSAASLTFIYHTIFPQENIFRLFRSSASGK